MMDVIDNLAELPVVCMGISVFLFLLGFCMIYGILDSLLKMHRSKSAVQKIKKEYKLIHRVWFIPFETNCIHAVKFCKGLILFWRIRCFTFALYLMLGLGAMFGLSVNEVIAWFGAGMFVFFDVPQFAIFLLLARPFIGRFREFSFEKYHNTKDRKSLL
ncbi:MAG: hypothetical protein IJZ39_01105 [Oscillospiraceae bacterium]|nr:hypothetical protein [Oscillospiraceae bacterium]